MRSLLYRSFLFAIAILGASVMYCQVQYPPSAEGQGPLSESEIDSLNDYAWSIARTNPDSALFLAEQASAESKAIGDYPKGLINSNMLLGILNKDRGYYGISVERYLEAMEMAEAVGDCLRVSACLNNLGVVAQQQENYAKALRYFQRSLEIENAFGTDKEQLSIRLFNIGDACERLDSLDEAYAFFYNSLLIEEQMESKEGIFYARLGIGKVDAKRGNYGKAADELGRALAYGRELGNHSGICETQLALGELYLSQRLFFPAQSAFEAALEKSREFRFQTLEKNALGGLYRLFKEKGEFEKALEMQEAYFALRDELNSAQVNSRIGELQTRYELKKKEQEIELLRKEDELQAAQMKYSQKQRNYLIFTVIFVLVIVVYNILRAHLLNKEHGKPV